MFDTHHGKYDGPLAALLERWAVEFGDTGTEGYSDSDNGEGATYWARPAGGLHELTWDDAHWLQKEYDATPEELDALATEMAFSFGLLGSWDSQGFVYGRAFETAEERDRVLQAIAETNDQLAEEG